MVDAQGESGQGWYEHLAIRDPLHTEDEPALHLVLTKEEQHRLCDATLLKPAKVSRKFSVSK